MDFKTIIKAIVPVAGSLVGTPLAGAAIAAIGAAIGMASPTVERVATAIQNGSLTPDQLAAVRKADADLKVRMVELGLDHERIEADAEKARLADVQSARGAHSGDKAVFYLGVAVLLTYAVVLAATLYGAYWLLAQGNLKDMDAGLVAAVFSLIGAILGYIASDAKQVVSYYFGSSRGQETGSREMADAVKQLGLAATAP